MARILIADDDEAFRAGVAETLTDAGHRVLHAEDGAAALRALERERIDIALLDLRMPAIDGLGVLRRRREKQLAPGVPVVVLTGFADAASTIEAMRLGAFDHLTKPVGRQSLLDVVAAAGMAAAAVADAPADDDEAAQVTRADAFIGSSAAMHEVQKRIGRAVGSAAPVLITGETGTGKEVVARLLHRHGDRAGRAFVAINCAAIPADLLESELFGHVKGAFSGATADRKGRFEQADGGILFLDEIGDMPLAMQAKLLRVLQEREVTPVGGQTARPVDVRVLAATHRDLAQAVVEGSFRADLRFRLDVLRIPLLPLRERLADILPLAEHFLRLVAPAKRLSRAASQRLLDHAWPGNVRELRNVIERAAVGAGGEVVGAEAIEIEGPGAAPATSTPAGPVDADDLDLNAAVARLERRLINEALARSGNNRAEAARLLGIRRQLLYAKLTALGLGGDGP